MYGISFAATGYRYGKSLIPITSEDENAMKLQAGKCLSVLGFTKCENVSLKCVVIIMELVCHIFFCVKCYTPS